MASKKPRFLTSTDSPFPDGYDLNGEREILKALIESDNPDPSDPLFPRFVEFEEREQKLQQMLAAKGVKQPTLAQQAREIGMLQADEDDVMTIHTRDAFRLFVGRPGGNGVRAIAGGQRVAASLRQLFALSANDNPYADWELVKFDQEIQAVRKLLGLETGKIIGLLDAVREKGLSYSVLKSSEPVQKTLGFASPYGYAIASTVVEFDYFSRVVKSAQKRDILSSDEAHKLLFNMKRACRSIFEPVVRAGSLLYREELRPLTRADFLSADEAAAKRVAAAQGLFGNIPKDVFIGDRMPRHTRRSVKLDEKELRLLESVPLADVSSVSPPDVGLLD